MCTAHEPPTAASVATAANVSAIPANKGRPLLRKGWSARAKTKGSTGRMHGLRMVSMPPRNTRATSVIWAFHPRQAPYHDAKHTVVDRVESDLITPVAPVPAAAAGTGRQSRSLERLRNAYEKAPPRPVLRGADADAGAVADLVLLVEGVDDVEA